MTLYERLKAAGIELDHHESDLYAKDSEQTRAIIEEHRKENNGYPLSASRFRSKIDGSTWWDIPFYYDPFWPK